MPRTTKDVKKDELENEKKVNKSTVSAKKTTTKSTKKTSAITKKKTTSKSSTAKKTSTTKTATSKTTKSSAATKTTKSTTSTKVAKISTSNKKTTRNKTTSSIKKVENNVVAEYYDLPYRYNETIVKILYQTPNILFVYWDISDADRKKFTDDFGDDFFNVTKPILKIFNLTKNYNFEVEIDDFANSWYINVNDADCDYKVELARKPISLEANINSDYIYISSSNDIEFPNDHILLEQLPNKVNFKNVKTNTVSSKDIGSLRLIGINKLYSVYDFYKKLYKDEILDEFNSKRINNPSSSTSSWS